MMPKMAEPERMRPMVKPVVPSQSSTPTGATMSSWWRSTLTNWSASADHRPLPSYHEWAYTSRKPRYHDTFGSWFIGWPPPSYTIICIVTAREGERGVEGGGRGTGAAAACAPGARARACRRRRVRAPPQKMPVPTSRNLPQRSRQRSSGESGCSGAPIAAAGREPPRSAAAVGGERALASPPPLRGGSREAVFRALFA